MCMYFLQLSCSQWMYWLDFSALKLAGKEGKHIFFSHFCVTDERRQKRSDLLL